MDCGVPFCQNGSLLAGMTSGCPLHNLVPETNDLIYRGTGNRHMSVSKRHIVFRNLPEESARRSVRRHVPVP